MGWICGTTEEAAEKGLRREEFDSWHLQGLKPDVHLMGFIGLTKVMPFYKAMGNWRCNEFFRNL